MAKGVSPLRRELDEQGFLYRGFARRLGITPWKFSRIEGGQQRAPDGYYERAAKLLGVPVASIVPQEIAPAG